MANLMILGCFMVPFILVGSAVYLIEHEACKPERENNEKNYY